jgi:hypothetical protein
MKDLLNKIVGLFGYEVNKPSLLRMYMHEVTHEGFVASLQRTNRLHQYEYRLYS